MSSPEVPSRRKFLKQAAITVAGVATGGAAMAAVTPPPVPPLPITSVQVTIDKVAAPSNVSTKAPVPSYVDAKFDDFVRGYDKLPGLITIYRYKNDLLMEIASTDIGKLFMLDATLSTGDAGMVGTVGQPMGDVAFKIDKRNDQIYFVEPNDMFRAVQKSPEALSISRSFADSFLSNFPIVAMSLSADNQKKADAMLDKIAKAKFIDASAQSYLIQLRSFFLSDITEYIDGTGGYHIDPSASYIKTLGVYPQNIVVQSLFALTGHAGFLAELLGLSGTIVDDRSIPVSVCFNMFVLPNGAGSDIHDYVPRYYDDRVGFFTADYETFDDDVSDDNIRRLIQRWHLVKKDPKAALSEPEKPITFWIDNGMPIRYRLAAQEAVLSWNKSFEQIGFKNAVVCNIMPDNCEWDVADIRYNVVRWMTSPGAGYAVALFRHNPFTGEIFSASVNIDASMARFTNVEYPIILSAMTGDSSAPAGAMNVLPVGNGQMAQLMTPKQIAQVVHHPKPWAYKSNRCHCELPTMSQCHAAFGWDAIDLEGLDGVDIAISLDDYTHAYLRMVMCHEVGHCLGLRHNFKGSTMLSPTQLQDSNSLDQYEVSSSVMDYLPPNVAPIGGKPVPKYFSANPGPYDQWAIAYGYTDFGNIIPAADTDGLRKIASQDRAFGHLFGSDENADDVDPSITRFDLSSDPMEFGLAMMQRGTTMLSNVIRKYPSNGDDYYELTRRFRRILIHTANDGISLSRFIGGVQTDRGHKGDPGAIYPVQPVAFNQQRKALQGICDIMLAQRAYEEPAAVLNQLEEDPRPFSDNSLFAGEERTDYSWLDLFSNVQQVALAVTLDPFALSRVETNEYRAGFLLGPDKPLTVIEILQTVSNAVWSEFAPHVGKNGNAAEISIPVLRRRTQRTHLLYLSELATVDYTGLSGDTKPFVMFELKRINQMLAAASKRPCDLTTQAHIADMRDGLDRLLSAKDIIPIGNGQEAY